ncbi:hypothetical protein RIF29_15041 [Crotalaria pallida]|uniref:Uncharacterized protein n=1 Tax=Crotalaria pallida TaxID=3830 RepID=A0AAN9FCG7_CROPI
MTIISSSEGITFKCLMQISTFNCIPISFPQTLTLFLQNHSSSLSFHREPHRTSEPHSNTRIFHSPSTIEVPFTLPLISLKNGYCASSANSAVPNALLFTKNPSFFGVIALTLKSQSSTILFQIFI